ncbi:hypothetical protein C2G38_1183910 [Gigaspora rosea]|uniref:Uncharacterized protein n=1 Tax=Gigaspora rosea TaxID=44941 RepID=A0A397VDP1_9GLOM|nr:hypothetical protein C2G38_1183910 [Gigaspora rosea]
MDKSSESKKIFLRCGSGRPPLRSPVIASNLFILCFNVPRKSHFCPTRARSAIERPSFRR